MCGIWSIPFGRRFFRYGIAVLSVAIALLIKLFFSPLLGIENPFLLFFAAIIVSTRYGGKEAGILSTVLAALVSDYLLLSPFTRFLTPV